MTLLNELQQYLRKSIGPYLDRTEGGSRLVICDLPQWVLDYLADEIKGNPILEPSIPAIVVDESVDNAMEDAGSPKSGKYRSEWLTASRNHFTGTWIALCPVGFNLPDSNGTTFKQLTNVQDGLLEQVINRLFEDQDDVSERLLGLCNWTCRRNQKGSNTKGQDLKWKLIHGLASLELNEEKLNNALAITGHVSCNAIQLCERRSRKHRSILDQISAISEERGIQLFMNELKEVAMEDDQFDSSVADAIEQCSKHLIEHVIDGASWHQYPQRGYGNIDLSKLDEEVWRKTLNLDIWDALLKAVGQDLPSEQRIVFVTPTLAPRHNKPKWEIVTEDRDATASIRSKKGGDDLDLEANWSACVRRQTRQISDNPCPKIDSTSVFNAIQETSEPVTLVAEVDGEEYRSGKLIFIANHPLGAVIDVAGADKITLPKATPESNDVFNAEIELPQEGRYTASLYLGRGVEVLKVTGRDIARDGEGESTEITFGPDNDKYTITFQLQSDDSSTYEIELKSRDSKTRTLRLDVTASSDPLPDSRSHFESLIDCHLRHQHNAAAVRATQNDDNIFARLGGPLLRELESWRPTAVVTGPGATRADLFDSWPPSRPINGNAFRIDPRPQDLDPPSEILELRKEIQSAACEAAGTNGIIEAAGIYAIGDEFRSNCKAYMQAWANWKLASPKQADWIDTVLVYEDFDGTTGDLPIALLLTPLHPLRIYWQAESQWLIGKSKDAGEFCPFAGGLKSNHCPSVWELIFNDQTRKKFVSCPNNSEYWSVLLPKNSLGLNHKTILALDSLKLGITGPTRSIGRNQTKSILSDTSELLPAAAGIQIELKGPANTGTEILSGVQGWFTERALPSEEEKTNKSGQLEHEWACLSSTPMELMVFDKTTGHGKICSEQLASIAETSSVNIQGKITWLNKVVGEETCKADLEMRTKTEDASPSVVNKPCGIAATPNLLFSFSPTWHAFPSGSLRPLTTLLPDEQLDPSPQQRTLANVQFHKEPNPALQVGHPDSEFESTSKLLAFPAGDLEPATLSHHIKSHYIWDFTRSFGGEAGYFVLANLDSDGNAALQRQIQKLDPNAEMSANQCQALLAEYGKRGIDALSATFSGGTKAAGGIGQITLARILQPLAGTLTAPLNTAGPDTPTIDLLVPLDPFAKAFDSVAKFLPNSKKQPLPDFMAISIRPEVDHGTLRIRLTPVEAKCYTKKIKDRERSAMLESQCRTFALFLENVFTKPITKDDAEPWSPEGQDLWSMGSRKFLCELIMAGIRTNTHVKDSGWNTDAGWAKACQICASIMNNKADVDVDKYGRLVIIDDSRETKFRHHDTTCDARGFKETLQITRQDAAKILCGTWDRILDWPGDDDDWRLRSPIEHEANVNSDPTAETPDSLSTGMREDANSHQSDNSALVKKAEELIATRGGQKKTCIKLTRAIKNKNYTRIEKILSNVQRAQSDSSTELTNPVTADTEQGVELSPMEVRLGSADSGPAYWDPFKSNDPLTNAHCVIVGQSGSGKTYTIKEIMAPQAVKSGANLFVLEFNNEFSGFTDAKAQRLDAATGLDFNPLVIPNKVDVESGDVCPGVVDVPGHVYEFAGAMKGTFKLGPVQEASLREALFDLYMSYGIDRGTAQNIGDTNTWPLFNELREYIEQGSGTPQLLARISSLFDLDIFSGTSGNTREMLDKTTIVALANLRAGEDTKAAVAALLMMGAYSTLTRLGQCHDQIRNVIIIDEAHKVTGHDVVRTLMREIRKFGGSLWLSSQMPGDFTDVIWDNAATTIFHTVAGVGSARTCSQILDNSTDMVEHLRDLPRGHAYVKNTQHSPWTRVQMDSPTE